MHHTSFPIIRFLSQSVACLALLAAVAGCRSTNGPASASFASVTITNHTEAEIQGATAKVFREAGFAGGLTGDNQMVFNKEASRFTSMGRDGVVATQGGARSLERVRVEIVPLGGGTCRLQCQAYMVSGAGDSFFEDEVAMLPIRSGPYRSLLGKVAKQLN